MRVYPNIQKEIHERFELREALNCLTTRQGVALVCLSMVPAERKAQFIRDLMSRQDLAVGAAARLVADVTDAEVLESLAVHARAEVRFAVGQNPSCPGSIRRRLSRDPVARVRKGARSATQSKPIRHQVMEAESDQMASFEEWWTYESTAQVEDALSTDPSLVGRIVALDETQFFARAHGQRDAPCVIAKRMTFDHLLRWASTSRKE